MKSRKGRIKIIAKAKDLKPYALSVIKRKDYPNQPCMFSLYNNYMYGVMVDFEIDKPMRQAVREYRCYVSNMVVRNKIKRLQKLSKKNGVRRAA